MQKLLLKTTSEVDNQNTIFGKKVISKKYKKYT